MRETCTASMYPIAIIWSLALLTGMAVVSGQQPNATTPGYDPVPAGYSKIEQPANMTIVNISMEILQIESVDESGQATTWTVSFRMAWTDPRLRLPPRASYPLDATKIWTPSIYFSNAMSVTTLGGLAPVSAYSLLSNGTVTLQTRFSIRLNCYMDLWRFPQDIQTCPMQVAALTARNTSLQLNLNLFSLWLRTNPKFVLVDLWRDTCQRNDDRSGEYSCVSGNLKFCRRLSYYVIRLYGPSFLLTITCFVGFWIPVLGWPARVAVTVTPLMSLITQQISVQAELANVGYTVAIHLWMAVCCMFSFLSLCEYAVAIKYCHHIDDKKAAAAAATAAKNNNNSMLPNVLTFQEEEGSNGCGRCLAKISHGIKIFLNWYYGPVPWHKDPRDRNRVDFMARLIYPAVYLTWVFIYFLVFLVPWINTFNGFKSYTLVDGQYYLA